MKVEFGKKRKSGGFGKEVMDGINVKIGEDVEGK